MSCNDRVVCLRSRGTLSGRLLVLWLSGSYVVLPVFAVLRTFHGKEAYMRMLVSVNPLMGQDPSILNSWILYLSIYTGMTGVVGKVSRSEVGAKRSLSPRPLEEI
jgi:hypothetical protein